MARLLAALPIPGYDRGPMLRGLLIAVLIHGLVPSVAELVEALVHVAATGHVAHDAAHHDEPTEASEHGCGPTAHHCGCCASQPVLSARTAPNSKAGVREGAFSWRIVEPVTTGLHAPPFRPPIAS